MRTLSTATEEASLQHARRLLVQEAKARGIEPKVALLQAIAEYLGMTVNSRTNRLVRMGRPPKAEQELKDAA